MCLRSSPSTHIGLLQGALYLNLLALCWGAELLSLRYHQAGNKNVIVSKQSEKEVLLYLEMWLGTEQDFCLYLYDRKITWDPRIRVGHKGYTQRER